MPDTAPDFEPKVAQLIEYLDLVDDRKRIEEQLRQAIEREKAQAKIVYNSPDYPGETMLLVTDDRAIMIDYPECNFEEYKWPDSPIKIYKVQDLLSQVRP